MTTLHVAPHRRSHSAHNRSAPTSFNRLWSTGRYRRGWGDRERTRDSFQLRFPFASILRVKPFNYAQSPPLFHWVVRNPPNSPSVRCLTKGPQFDSQGLPFPIRDRRLLIMFFFSNYLVGNDSKDWQAMRGTLVIIYEGRGRRNNNSFLNTFFLEFFSLLQLD